MLLAPFIKILLNKHWKLLNNCVNTNLLVNF